MKSKSSNRCKSLASGVVLVLILGVILGSCFDGEETAEELALPQTPILTAGPEWAVVDEPYVRLFKEPALEAPVVGYDRQGSVLVVQSQTNYRATVKGREEHWYLLEGEVATGWAFGAHLKLFVSRDRADNAATFYDR